MRTHGNQTHLNQYEPVNKHRAAHWSNNNGAFFHIAHMDSARKAQQVDLAVDQVGQRHVLAVDLVISQSDRDVALSGHLTTLLVLRCFLCKLLCG